MGVLCTPIYHVRLNLQNKEDGSMKYTIEQGDDELILRYQTLNQEIEYVMDFISFSEKKLIGLREGAQIVIDIKE